MTCEDIVLTILRGESDRTGLEDLAGLGHSKDLAGVALEDLTD